MRHRCIIRQYFFNSKLRAFIILTTSVSLYFKFLYNIKRLQLTTIAIIKTTNAKAEFEEIGMELVTNLSRYSLLYGPDLLVIRRYLFAKRPYPLTKVMI
jgi:hypothetical protein